jgi:glycosyltransferase involved in cell wall biosynthesis
MKKLSIIIPAHNEQNRIGRTLERYATYFDTLKKNGLLDTEFVVVNNASADNTIAVVQQATTQFPAIRLIDLPAAGKGLAIAAGFQDALTRENDLIGFVDADMSTLPEHFYDLVTNLGSNDGIIASRYMKGSTVTPPRPFIKYWGRKLVYDNMVRLFFGLPFHDFQCGAKLFTRQAIATIAPHCTIKQWAFDVELLYLCKRHKFHVIEIPTVWEDQTESKLQIMRSGTRMLGSVVKLRLLHSPMRGWVNQQNV